MRVFNYNTLERQHAFDAHSDYVRSIAAHPTQPFILTSSGESSREIISRIFSRDKILCPDEYRQRVTWISFCR